MITVQENLDNGMSIVIIEKVSLFTGKTNKMQMCLDLEDYRDWHRGNVYIQDALPYLTTDEREFLISGITPEEWEKAFG